MTCDPSAYLKRCSRHSNGFLMSKSPPGYLLSISFPSFSSREPTGFLALSLPVINKGPLSASSLPRCSNFGLRRNFQFAPVNCVSLWGSGALFPSFPYFLLFFHRSFLPLRFSLSAVAFLTDQMQNLYMNVFNTKRPQVPFYVKNKIKQNKTTISQSSLGHAILIQKGEGQ